jgi:hypothetical protein
MKNVVLLFGLRTQFYRWFLQLKTQKNRMFILSCWYDKKVTLSIFTMTFKKYQNCYLFDSLSVSFVIVFHNEILGLALTSNFIIWVFQFTFLLSLVVCLVDNGIFFSSLIKLKFIFEISGAITLSYQFTFTGHFKKKFMR